MKTECYLVVEPVWEDDGLVDIKVVKSTRRRPNGGSASIGSAIVHLTLEMPKEVFMPYRVDADIEVGEGEIGIVRVTSTPFEGV